MTRPWPLLQSHPVFDAGVFRVFRDRAQSPRTGQARDFHVLHMADWLSVLPLTTSGQVVMVRQYRHGSRRDSLELPGGLHDGIDEQPDRGAARELAEETGYATDEPLQILGVLHPQPALLANRAWIYLARNVSHRTPPRPDAGEDIDVVLLDAAEIGSRIASGEIDNAMTLAALGLARIGGHF
ncbi:MAG: NUDIX hydrolase [Burkholderiaceae bacterium]|jgi:8-oxo-dGTP pyrophosphatase MutT (NUDIX family)|nr:NUDIX hydrolase [Burkholderiaceae bacterium]